MQNFPKPLPRYIIYLLFYSSYISGFANYISIYAGEKLDKSMEFKKLVLTDLMIPAMKIDSYASSHPISTSANTPNEIREIFDTITYRKGNCMVQMLLNYLGEDNFRKGLQRYLTSYSYKNADQDDLWEELRYNIFSLKFLSFPTFFSLVACLLQFYVVITII